MSFRRLPFQFASTDPVERQAELQKRFGLPAPNDQNMYVDVENPFSMGSARIENSGSPRLQHRIPIFQEGQEYPIQSSVDQTHEVKKPHVRVIPIEVEGDYHPSNRHRTCSGPAGKAQVPSPAREEKSCLKRSVQDLSQPSKPQQNGGSPKVHNIPIQIESKASPFQKILKFPKSCEQKERLPKSVKSHNGSTVSKKMAESKNDSTSESNAEKQYSSKLLESQKENSMKKIKDVLQELEAYEKGVYEFSGTMKDKQYRYLDEMLTRCMLRLDNVDTMGDANIRSARKNAVKKVQASIDLLESKVRTEEIQTSENTPDVDMLEGSSETLKVEPSLVVHGEPGALLTESQKTDVNMPEDSETPEAENTELDRQPEVPVTGQKVAEVEMQEVSVTPKVDQNISVSGQPEIHATRVQNNSVAEEDTLTVTEIEPDTEGEIPSQEPDVVEPNDIEMFENKVKTDIQKSIICEEPQIEIEEVDTDVSSNTSEVPEVEMAEMETSPVVNWSGSSKAMTDEPNTEHYVNMLDNNIAVTEIKENETDGTLNEKASCSTT